MVLEFLVKEINQVYTKHCSFTFLHHELKYLNVCFMTWSNWEAILSLPKTDIDFVYAVGMQSPCLRIKVKLHECFCLYRLQINSLSLSLSLSHTHTHTHRMSLILKKIKSLNNKSGIWRMKKYKTEREKENSQTSSVYTAY